MLEPSPILAGKPEAAVATEDPLAAFLSDPESHLSDILYLYFRIYKKKLLWRFLQMVMATLRPSASQTLHLADIGASMGFDALYLLRRLTKNFRQPLPCNRIVLSLVEGDQELIARGEKTLQTALRDSRVEFSYHHSPLVESLPLAAASQDLTICSEVVEHLEAPESLLRELFRILKPGGFLILTTDNSPSFLQHLRRIPVLLRGRYREAYTRPSKESVIEGTFTWRGREYPIYGHLNLNPTRHWEKLSAQAGFAVASYGTYESLRRGGGSKSPLVLASYFGLGALVYYLMPRRLGRFFGDTTALLLRKPPT